MNKTSKFVLRKKEFIFDIVFCFLLIVCGIVCAYFYNHYYEIEFQYQFDNFGFYDSNVVYLKDNYSMVTLFDSLGSICACLSAIECFYLLICFWIKFMMYLHNKE